MFAFSAFLWSSTLIAASHRLGASLGKVLNFGIIASAFGIFVSLSDFLLTPKKKKRIENFIDSITLSLSYTHTLDWLQKWLATTRRAQLVRKSFAILHAFIALSSLLFFGYWLSDFGWFFSAALSMLLAAGWYFSLRPGVEEVYETIGVQMVEWLATRPSYGVLLLAYSKTIFIGLCVFAFLGADFYFFVEEHGFESLRPLGYAIAPVFYIVFGLFLCWLGVVLDGVITIIGSLIVLLLQRMVNVGRWLMWRISSYPKGPLTATLTLVGAVFAVVKMFTSK